MLLCGNALYLNWYTRAIYGTETLERGIAMTTLTLNRFAFNRFFGRFGAGRVLGVIVAFIDGVLEGREIETRYERLRRMSDSDLACLGLTRTDIPRAAVNGIAGL
jgi:hypothetical protein